MTSAARPRMTIAAPLLRGGGELHVVGDRDVLTISDPDGVIHLLISLADGSRSTDELACELAVHHPQLGAHDVGEAVCELASAGLLEDCAPRRRTFPSPTAPSAPALR